MKQHLSTLFFLLISSQMISQNWLPFQPGDTCLLRSDTSEYFAHTVWFDSVSSAPETYWFTPSHLEVGKIWSSPQLFTGLSYPFGGAMVLEDSGRVVLDDLRGRRILLLPAAGPGSQWLLDTAAAVTASVSSVGWGSVMGQPDSIKTIRLSNGDSLVFSRLYGLVSFPERLTKGIRLRMAGIPNRGIGEEVLDFWDIYDFQVGMELNYEYGYGDVGINYDSKSKVIILDKTIKGDTIIITGSSRGKLSSWGYYTGGSEYPIPPHTVKWIFVNQSNRIENAWPNRLKCFGTSFGTGWGTEVYWGEYQLFDPSLVSASLVSGTARRYEVSYDRYERFVPSQEQSFPCTGDLGLNEPDTFQHNPRMSSFVQRFEKGLGQTVFGYGGFEQGFGGTLVGYIRGEDTVGTIYTAKDLFVGIEDELWLDGLRVFPNPATEHLSLEAGNPGDLPATVRLTDLQGRTVLETPMSQPSISIDIRSLASGLYFLEAESRQGKRLRMKVWVREK